MDNIHILKLQPQDNLLRKQTKKRARTDMKITEVGYLLI
jgi:hypothetical protein